MELQMNKEIENPAKRRKVEVVLKSQSSFSKSPSPIPKHESNVIDCLDTQKVDSYLLSSEIVKSKLQTNFDQVKQPNKILLFTVINPSYPITCDIMNKICSPIASVLRIVIIRKNGVIQAMIEFESINDANSVKESLNGCDIYPGCCTLKVEFSQISNGLHVCKNDNETWDYTKVIEASIETSTTSIGVSPRRVLLDLPNHTDDKFSRNTVENQHSNFDNRLDSFLLPSSTFALTEPRHINFKEKSKPGSVCIVYGLNMNKMNASRVFNLFCLYGNVVRIKFLKTKEGCALVQMSDFLAVERLVSLLHEVSLFGSNLHINCSKQHELSDVTIPYQLPDSSLSFQDFSKSNLNRFSTTQLASKNRIQRPTNALHFYNTPPNIEKSDIVKIFENGGDRLKPVSANIFPAKSDKSSSGMILFESLEQALEALVIFNHQPVLSSSSKYPYIMKLCFSTSSVSPIP